MKNKWKQAGGKAGADAGTRRLRHRAARAEKDVF